VQRAFLSPGFPQPQKSNARSWRHERRVTAPQRGEREKECWPGLHRKESGNVQLGIIKSGKRRAKRQKPQRPAQFSATAWMWSHLPPDQPGLKYMVPAANKKGDRCFGRPSIARRVQSPAE
jgi:hypothetical protein